MCKTLSQWFFGVAFPLLQHAIELDLFLTSKIYISKLREIVIISRIDKEISGKPPLILWIKQKSTMLARLYPSRIHKYTFGIYPNATLRKVNKKCVLLIDQVFHDRISPWINIRTHLVIIKLAITWDVIQNLLVANLESFHIVWTVLVGCIVSAKLSSEFIVMQHCKEVGRDEVYWEPIVDWRDQNWVIFKISRHLAIRQICILDSSDFSSQRNWFAPLLQVHNFG